MATAPQDLAAYKKLLIEPPPPGQPYSVAIPGTERPGRSPIYRHWRFRDTPLLERFDASEQTLHDLFENAVARWPRNRCLGWRPWNPATQKHEPKYVWYTYKEVAERRKNFGAGIVELHNRIGVTQDKYGVGIWSQNRPEWHITELGLLSQSLFPVSLYETLGPETTEYIVNHAELSCIIASLPHIPALLKLAPRIPNLKLIISLDSLDAGEPAGYSKMSLLSTAAADVGVQIFQLGEVEAIGAASGRGMRPPHKEDLITINYTSGTTGNPKGVVLSHAAAVAAITSSRVLDTFGPTDTHLSYLPLAHIYGRMIDHSALSTGTAVGYFHGDIAALVEDLKILKPAALMSVPRLYNRINSSIQAATVQADGFKGALSRRVIETKKANMNLPRGQATNKHFFYDKIWTPKVLKAVGLENARHMISGSAQLDPDVQTFLRAAFGNRFLQGFGMTETYSVGFLQGVDDFQTGTIGFPSTSSEVCIESVPDFDYTVDDKPNPRGELLMRGPIMFNEYFKNPEENQKTIEPDGWFHTGDIVEVDKTGRFRIIDRKKNVLKLAQGEYISPERIENVYLGSSSLLASAFVHGDPKEATLVGIFGVDPVQFAPFASKVLKKNIEASDLEAIKVACGDAKVKAAVLKVLDGIGKSHKFVSYERVRNLHLAIEPFTIENELLTPTLKLKRPQAVRAFRSEIDRMYQEIAAEPGSKPKL